MAKKAANRTFTSLSVIMTASILLSACISGPGGVFLQSVEKDQELGRQVAKQVTAELGIVEEPTTTAYLREVGHRLGRVQEDQRFQYSFYIVDQYEPNAFAAPGGWVYFTRGLLALTNDEDELAAVMGHEITHVSRRHTARRLAQARGFGLLSLPGRIVGGVISKDLGNLINAPVTALGAVYIA